ncbi:MAG: DUF3575 domain-containing protein [Treponema sp.]|nr:DUF3575 domain-containing protein [Treponema sp.]
MVIPLYSIKPSMRLIMVLFLVLSAVSVQAQDKEEYDLFIAPLAEIIGYSKRGSSFGAGLALGAGSGTAIGARFLYAVDPDSFQIMEIAVFTRFYFQGSKVSTGPFAQLNAGAAIYNHQNAAAPPADDGSFSLGLAFGWRFPLRNRLNIEPSVRVGYPYIAGAGVSLAFQL